MLVADGENSLLDKLEQGTLSHQTPMALGIWWFWRCFNPSVDKRVRASFVAVAYAETFIVVDFKRLESLHENAERKGKELVRRILSAKHILKVTHALDKGTLEILQLTLIMNKDLNMPSAQLHFQEMSPVLDMTIVFGFAKHIQPRSSSISTFSKLVNEYFRLEFCMGECVSNWDRRPLRLSQLHYALTLAWCPLMLLRTLAKHQVVAEEDLLNMTLQLGYQDAPADWDSQLQRFLLCPDYMEADDQEAIGGNHLEHLKMGDNPWKVAAWVGELQHASANDTRRNNFWNPIPQALKLSDDMRLEAWAALHSLSDGNEQHLDAMYTAWKAITTTWGAGTYSARKA